MKKNIRIATVIAVAVIVASNHMTVHAAKTTYGTDARFITEHTAGMVGGEDMSGTVAERGNINGLIRTVKKAAVLGEILLPSADADADVETEKPSFGGMELRYSEPYPTEGERLTRRRGVLWFNGHRETYYSQRVLPGGGLDIPGRHVAEDGTVRDGDGYIVVAADMAFLPRGTEVMTSLGPAKIYDTGCDYGTVDIYVDW